MSEENGLTEVWWNGQTWMVPADPVSPSQAWEDMVKQVLRLVAERVLPEPDAARWLRVLVEFAEVTYAS